MARRLRVLAIVVAALLLLGGGFFLLRGPKPIIEIKGEVLWTVGPLDITNTLFTSWIVVILLIGLAYLATRRVQLIPSGVQNAAEGVIEAIYGLVESTAGERHARRFFPVIATMFLYIVCANWFALFPIFNAIGKMEEVSPDNFHEEAVVYKDSGVNMILPGSESVEIEVDTSPCEGLQGDDHRDCITDQRETAIDEAQQDADLASDEKLGVLAPYFRSVNTDLMSTLSLAIASAIFVEYWGISALGLVGYGSKFFNFRRLMHGNPMGIIDVFVGILEFIAEFARLISFTFRLFGNMLAGEILLLIMTFLIPVLLALPFYGLELFVGAIQAFVFAMLTLVFGVLAVTGHGDEHTDAHDTHAAPVEATAPAE